MPAPAVTDYEIYLRVPELLSLQKRPEELSCEDELQFQIVHQTAELWMRLIDFEMDSLCKLLRRGACVCAVGKLKRVHQIQRILLEQIQVLYTMTPGDYMRIREVLGRGSGQESPGFRRLLALPAEVWAAFAGLLEQRGVELRALYERPQEHAELLAVAEGLLDFDLLLQEWRNRHILLVYRTIGVGTPSLKGKHSELLERGVRRQFFPQLWEVRDELYAAWTARHPSGADYGLAKQG